MKKHQALRNFLCGLWTCAAVILFSSPPAHAEDLPGLIGIYGYGGAQISDTAVFDPSGDPWGWDRLAGIRVEVEVSGIHGWDEMLTPVWPEFTLSVRDPDSGTVLIEPTLLGPVEDSPTTLWVAAEWNAPYWPAPVDTEQFEVTLQTPEVYPGLIFTPGLQVISARMYAWYDDSGFIGLQDLDMILNTWNQWVAPHTPGDITGDGYVGLDDLDIVLQDWNSGTPPAVVPEPGMIVLWLLGCGLVCKPRRLV